MIDPEAFFEKLKGIIRDEVRSCLAASDKAGPKELSALVYPCPPTDLLEHKDDATWPGLIRKKYGLSQERSDLLVVKM
jgi:hypothetical protein